jgi:hypothetical protein
MTIDRVRIDAQRREAAVRALRLLRTGALLHRIKLFPALINEAGGREFTRRFLELLIKEGAIRKTLKPKDKNVYYVLTDINIVDKILAMDTQAFAGFIFDNQAEQAAPAEPSADTEDSELVIKAVPTDNGQLTQLDPRSLEETNRLLGEMALTLNASMQAIIHFRDDIETMKRELAAMASRQDAVLEGVAKLITDLGGAEQ